MFYSWRQDLIEKNETFKDHAYLIGGFSNPEMLKSLINKDADSISISDDDFEQSLKMVKESGLNESLNMENSASLKRRRRRKK